MPLNRDNRLAGPTPGRSDHGKLTCGIFCSSSGKICTLLRITCSVFSYFWFRCCSIDRAPRAIAAGPWSGGVATLYWSLAWRRDEPIRPADANK